MSAKPPTPDIASGLELVEEPVFFGIVWTCVGLSFIFLVLRLYVRISLSRRLFDDDYLVLLAWIILLTCTILWHVEKTLDLVYLSLHVGFGTDAPTPYYLEHFVSWLKILFSEMFLNILGLWAVKFSFLMFFRRLSSNVRGQKVLWYTVTALTTIGMAVAIGVIYYPCIFTTLEALEQYCPTPAAGEAIFRSYRIQFGCDFATDIIILLIPIWLLWKVQLSLRKKLGILAMFFLTVITMIFSLVRIIIGLRYVREDNVWFFFCGTIELTLSIIMACIITFPSFFKRKNQRSTKQSGGSYDTPSRYAKRHNGSENPYTNISAVERADGDTIPLQAVNVVALDRIRAKNDVEVHTQNRRFD